MYWQQCASFPVRNGEGLTTSYELILVGSFCIPIGVSVFKPCYRIDDQGGNGVTVSIVLYDNNDLNTAVYTRETTMFTKSNEVVEDTVMPVDDFSTDSGFRRVFFRVYAKTVAGSGTFYEFIAALPRIEGLDF
jgi:hypothetical protein